MEWQNAMSLPSKTYNCGYCGNALASNFGYRVIDGGGVVGRIYICHYCYSPTYFGKSGVQHPGAPYGKKVEHIDSEDVVVLYDEAKDCIKAGNPTASVLCSRKLLMHIAVSKGARNGLSFIEYVEFLAAKGYIPPDGEAWVDHIRTKGNEANHEIKIMNRSDAEELINFLEMLLKFIYEFPGKLKVNKSADK
jgi:hypothetical protein